MEAAEQAEWLGIGVQKQGKGKDPNSLYSLVIIFCSYFLGTLRNDVFLLMTSSLSQSSLVLYSVFSRNNRNRGVGVQIGKHPTSLQFAHGICRSCLDLLMLMNV